MKIVQSSSPSSLGSFPSGSQCSKLSGSPVTHVKGRFSLTLFSPSQGPIPVASKTAAFSAADPMCTSPPPSATPRSRAEGQSMRDTVSA